MHRVCACAGSWVYIYGFQPPWSCHILKLPILPQLSSFSQKMYLQHVFKFEPLVPSKLNLCFNHWTTCHFCLTFILQFGYIRVTYASCLQGKLVLYIYTQTIFKILTLTCLFLQFQTIQMMYSVVAMELKSAQIPDAHPLDYLNFYCLGNREKLPSEALQSSTDATKVVAQKSISCLFSLLFFRNFKIHKLKTACL